MHVCICYTYLCTQHSVYVWEIRSQLRGTEIQRQHCQYLRRRFSPVSYRKETSNTSNTTKHDWNYLSTNTLLSYLHYTTKLPKIKKKFGEAECQGHVKGNLELGRARSAAQREYNVGVNERIKCWNRSVAKGLETIYSLKRKGLEPRRREQGGKGRKKTEVCEENKVRVK